MITQLGFSILTAPLAAIDRRSLSQAWYSALHLAHATKPQSSYGRTNAKPSIIEDKPRRCGAPWHAVRLGDRAAPNPRKGQGTLAPPRRRNAAPNVRRSPGVSNGPFSIRSVRIRATFTIDGTQARVHVALQTTASGVRLVAVCPAAIRVDVARALDEARYALALRGIALRIDVNEA